MRGLTIFALLLSIVLSMLDIDLYEEAGYFKITSIKEKKEVYIIHATRNKNGHRLRYLIVSDKNPVFKGKRIMVGKTYYLELSCLLPVKSINGIEVVPNLGVVGLGYGKTVIKTNRKFHYSIYHADNLHGLYMDNP